MSHKAQNVLYPVRWYLMNSRMILTHADVCIQFLQWELIWSPIYSNSKVACNMKVLCRETLTNPKLCLYIIQHESYIRCSNNDLLCVNPEQGGVIGNSQLYSICFSKFYNHKHLSWRELFQINHFTKTLYTNIRN
jgi:hypothetical protein